MRAADVRVAAERLHVDLDLADGLCAVDDGKRAAAARERAQLARREKRTETARDVAEHHDFRAWRHRGFEQPYDRLRSARERGLQRQFLDDDPAALREQAPGRDPAAVLLVGADYLVTRGEVEAVGEEIHPHGRVLRKRDFGGRCIHELPSHSTDVEQLLVSGQWLAIGLLVRPGCKIGFQAADAFGQRIHDFPGRCAQGSGIAVGDARGDQEVPTCRCEHGRVVRRWFRYECGAGERLHGRRRRHCEAGDRQQAKEPSSCAHGVR